jgi:hypothetical protein
MIRNFGLASILLYLPLLLWGQASNSTVRGAVRDQAQAVVPGAKVSLSNPTPTSLARPYRTRPPFCLSRPLEQRRTSGGNRPDLRVRKRSKNYRRRVLEQARG